jgi:hypothetical protein
MKQINMKEFEILWDLEQTWNAPNPYTDFFQRLLWIAEERYKFSEKLKEWNIEIIQ